ncbi:uncharacterized protein BP5553_04442 [Venustampulla echinocandica]|uniref:Bud22 domain-containing protein n=1 Tax=Venustampulla echinocandica TaxID=2656787 RepID=A0A370TNB5_9HELO|nr:uncharacterized protein BP5553_04442 [Venustampulla echinocandica]RDL37009.1 hypothetical protein BP5553_04442 [Venustampulla echinocandica]
MLKRKRSAAPNSADRTKQDVLDTLLSSQKHLQRALKTAKGFERQKLGKRLKLAQAKGPEGTENVARINREIAALKGLDLVKTAESYLCAKILKIKRMAESESLPEEVREKGLRKEGEGLGEEEAKALKNVTSGLFNLKNVKEVMGQVMRGLYMVMRIPLPEVVGNGKGKGAVRRGNGSAPTRMDTEQKNIEIDVGDKDSLPEWEGFDSAADEQQHHRRTEGEEGQQASDLDSEDFSHYDALLGSSESDSESDSESESEREPTFKSQHTESSLSQSRTRASLSLSPSPPPTSRTRSRPSATTTKGTTFLPTLLGGYFSGSESSASDIEDAPPPKKNRPGQMARRAIWEKKYGEKANHIQGGQGSVNDVRPGNDDGWDARRGAKDGGRGRGRGGMHGSGGGGHRITGGNAVAQAGGEEGGKRGLGRKDDVGVLHPSWQAAKKAKEMKKTATFQGKKVTFD